MASLLRLQLYEGKSLNAFNKHEKTNKYTTFFFKSADFPGCTLNLIPYLVLNQRHHPSSFNFATAALLGELTFPAITSFLNVFRLCKHCFHHKSRNAAELLVFL